MKLNRNCKNCNEDDWYCYKSGIKVCRPCKLKKNKEWYEKNPSKRLEYVNRWQSKNPDHSRNSRLKRTYGITSEQYDHMIDEQGGLCAICKSDSPNTKHGKWHIDHNHETGNIRGLLCHNCNVSLGLVKDDASILLSMVAYLQEGADGIRKRAGL